jgi:hypothetical protein
VLTSFTLNFNSVSVSAGDASQLIVSLDGVVQEPLGAYTLGVGGSTIVFGTAPVAGSTCHIVQLGGVGGTITGTLTDNIVTTTKIGAGAVTSDRITIDGAISFPDDTNLKFGDDDDGQVYYNSTNDTFYIYNYSADGGTIIQNNSATGGIALQPVPNENAVYCSPNGAVQLYYNGGSSKLQTTSTGINVTGTASATNTSAGVTTALNLYNNTSGANNRVAIDFYTAFTKYGTIEGGYGATSPEMNFKVGAVSPAQILKLNSTGIDVTGTASASSFSATGDSDTSFSFPAANQLSLIAGGAEVARAYQIAGAYGVIRANGTGSATYPNFTFNGDDNTGMYRGGADTLSFASGGTKILDVDTSGISVNGEIGLGNGTTTYGTIGYHNIGRLNYDSDEHWFRTAGSSSTYMFLTNIHPNAATGYVQSAMGIGTSQPQHELDVYGTARFHNARLKEIYADPSTYTALNVFVYDTRKDSDGGAWRKRTQNTSWYNETLNTNIRGSRKEFPSVAVIVTEASRVVIYDADEPDTPMWMVFKTVHPIIGRTSAWSSVTSCSMLNGTLIFGNGSNSAECLLSVNFVSDNAYLYPLSGYSGYGGPYTLGIAQRASSYNYDTSPTVLVGAPVFDCSMTVLPSAPIDSNTGLPVPTIAVATGGGLSVIKDNGSIVDIVIGAGGYNDIRTVDVSPDGYIAWRHNDTRSAKAAPIPEVDKSYGFWTYGQDAANDAYNYYESHAYASNLGNIPALVSVGGGLKDHIVGKVVSGSDGLTMIGLQKNEPADVYNTASLPLTAYVTEDYNTGWMMSGIALATLSDTDDTNVTGTELIATSSSFTNTTGWYLDAANTSSGTIATLTTSGNNLVFTHSSTNNSWDGFGTSGTFVVGQTYIIDTTIVSSTNINVLRITDSASQHDADIATTINSAGTHSFTFVATATTMYFHWNGYYTTSAITISGFSVRLAEKDRSWHENGLQVFGTVTKTAVATGAELVGYSGFSNSTNYLAQPYNSDLDFGTGNFSISGWINFTGSATRNIITRTNGTNGLILQSTGKRLRLRIHNSGDFLAYFNDVLEPNVWNHFVILRKNGYVTAFLNGKEEDSGISDDMSHTVSVNSPMTLSENSVDTLALLRMSSTAPSAEQIYKMYNDEKYLFRENAKATIYGTSSHVQAVAYDDVMDHLHVGTTEGRSVFQGLNRVDNTTNAISTALSASNGIVAEE